MLGGLIVLIVGAMLVREIIKRKRRPKTRGCVDTSQHGVGSTRPPREVEPVALPTEPVELPDSPSTLGGRSEVPLSPGSTTLPVSPMTVDHDGR